MSFENLGSPSPDNVIELQQFADSSELYEVQQLLRIFKKQQLERSFASKPTDVGLKEFLAGIAEWKNQPIDDVVEAFSECMERLDVLAILESQILTQQERYLEMRTFKFSVEEELLLDLTQSLHNQAADFFESSSYIFDTYWEYIPSDVQRTLLVWAEAHVGEVNFCKNVAEGLKTAVFNMQQTLKSAKETGITKLPFEISSYVSQEFPDWQDFPKRKKIEVYAKDADNSTKISDKKYTLRNIDEIAKEINPENSHEATDWGPPVGEEFW